MENALSDVEFSIPTWKELTKRHNWTESRNDSHTYDAVRLHFRIDYLQSGEKNYSRDMGEVFQVIEPDEFNDAFFNVDTQVAVLDVRETIESMVANSSLLRKISAKVDEEITTSGASELSSSLRYELKTIAKHERDKMSYSAVLRPHKIKENCVIPVSKRQLNEPLYLLRYFHKRTALVTLTYIDFLEVQYKNLLFFKRKRRKDPTPHKNIMKLNIPVIKFFYWEDAPRPGFFTQSEYNLAVPDACEIIPANFNGNRDGYAHYPSVHSLYRLSNAAFPLKRRDQRTNWTDEEIGNLLDL